MDSALLSFISDLQLQLKSKFKSDAILRTLCLYAEKKITRSTCLTIVFTLLRSNAALTQRFAAIIEEVPPTLSRSGCLTDDPFLITVTEFELWPGALQQFLFKIRDAMLKKGNLLDAFVYLEHIKATSGPFWLLWELFKPISQTNHFMQLIYDGCVKYSYVPRYLNTDIPPSQSDLDPSAITHQKIVDSELVCTYPNDIFMPDHPIGRIKKGSYGLLPSNKVDCTCSGRRITEFCACNDRWAISAAGLDCNFSFVQRNTYEERIFDNEDERVTMDVTITRMRSTIYRLNALVRAIADPESEEAQNIPIDTISFPQHNLTPLDFLTLEDIYGQENIEPLLFSITQHPIKSLEMIIERITQKMNELQEYRRQKESDYHEFNKRNIKKSLDKKNEPHASTNNTTQLAKEEDPLIALDDGKKLSLDFDQNVVLFAEDLINRSCRASLQHMQCETTATVMKRFILVFLGINEKNDSEIFIKNEPCVNPNTDLSTLYLTPHLFRLVYLFWQICETLNIILRDNSLNFKDAISKNSSESNEAQGYKVAQMLGFTTQNISDATVVRDALLEAIPQYIASSKHSTLESQFEIPQKSPLPSIDHIKRAIITFVITVQTISLHSQSLDIIEATQIIDRMKYRAAALNSVAGSFYIKCHVKSESDLINCVFEGAAPRAIRRYKSINIHMSPTSHILRLELNDLIRHQDQIKDFMKTRISGEGAIRSRHIVSELSFRIGFNGVEFRNVGHDFIQPDQ